MQATSTLTDNLIAKITESEDEEQLTLLLDLFEDIPAADLPIEELVDFLLTTNTNGQLWLITNEMQAIWDKACEYILEDTTRIPAEPVIAALRHALEEVDPDDEEADSDLDNCLEQMVFFATALEPFPADILAELLAHPRSFVRRVGLDALYQMDREPEMQPALQDPDAEVRSWVVQHGWKFFPLAMMQAMAQNDPEETVRTAAALSIENAQKYGQAQPTA